MSKIVYFLGAGASKPFGVPLTNEILPLILKSLKEKDLFTFLARGDYTKVQREDMEKDLSSFINYLLPGLSIAYQSFCSLEDDKEKQRCIRLPLITDVLSIIDHLMANRNRPFFNSGAEKPLEYYKYLLDRAIFEILADEAYTGKNEKIILNRFVEKIISDLKNKKDVVIITTNYDTTVETDLYKNLKDISKIDFGFSWRKTGNGKICYSPDNAKLHIYKLHGSLNWLRCDMCDHVYMNEFGNIAHQAFRKTVDDNNSCHCNNGKLQSVIVSPSFVRDVRDANLLHIWKNALYSLSTADEWVIAGYSLPSEDLAIKSLLIRGKNSRSNLLTKDYFKVVQKGFDSEMNYRLFLEKIILNLWTEALSSI